MSPNGASADAGDPAESKRPRGGLMSYEQLYALWERQNWRAHELDFSVDREHWLVSPAESQRHTAFSIGSFYVGEERVTADLAPFVLAAPSGEIEAFLATQLVDEMRHAVFFDRWASEVMGLESGSFRARLHEIEDRMLGPWRFLFDDSLRDVAERIKAKPDDLELFVEGIVTYHMVTEGVLAMPGQRIMIEYTADHDLYPGFNQGFRLVEQDEHRHIAFGVRFLKDVCDERPEMKRVILKRLEELLPKAAEVFCPPEADDPSDFFSYGHHSSQIYGFAYQALKRRMAAIGIEIPPPERLMPGPVDFGGLAERRVLAEEAARQPRARRAWRRAAQADRLNRLNRRVSDANIRSCQRVHRSCTPMPMPSSPRLSSGTIRVCEAGPTIVGAGVVMAASYEARAHGIHGGMSGWRARRLCPEAVVVPPRFDAYVEASRGAFRSIRRDRTARRGTLPGGGVPWTCAGWRGSRGPRRRSPSGCGAAHGSESVWRSPSASPGRRSSPRWRAGPPSRTACSSSSRIGRRPS